MPFPTRVRLFRRKLGGSKGFGGERAGGRQSARIAKVCRLAPPGALFRRSAPTARKPLIRRSGHSVHIDMDPEIRYVAANARMTETESPRPMPRHFLSRVPSESCGEVSGSVRGSRLVRLSRAVPDGIVARAVYAADVVAARLPVLRKATGAEATGTARRRPLPMLKAGGA